MIGESGNMDPKSELGVKKALHPPETLHFCGSQGISTPGLKRAKMLIFKPLVGRYERFGLILTVSDRSSRNTRIYTMVRCIVLQMPCFQGFTVLKRIPVVYFNKSTQESHTVAKFYSVEILQLNNYAVIAHKNFTVLKQSEYSVNITNCIELCPESLLRHMEKTNCQYNCTLENNILTNNYICTELSGN